jgi:transposase-like protein
LRIPQEIEEKILYLGKTYHFGAEKISWNLERYPATKLFLGGVQGVLRGHGLNCLPQNIRSWPRKSVYKLYEKQVPDHHVQIDVKFLRLIDKSHKTVRRFQYTAIDDAKRIRVLKIYGKLTQKNAID